MIADQINGLTDTQIATALAKGDIKPTNSDWVYIGKTNPNALKIYAVVLGVLGYL